MLATEIARPKTSPADQPHPIGDADQGAEQRRDEALTQGAGHGDFADGQQLLEVELQADAEHQQDDADLGELVGEVLVGDEAGRIGPDDEPGEQVADDGGEPEAEASRSRRRAPRPGRPSG